jgi:hypothetical protein
MSSHAYELSAEDCLYTSNSKNAYHCLDASNGSDTSNNINASTKQLQE